MYQFDSIFVENCGVMSDDGFLFLMEGIDRHGTKNHRAKLSKKDGHLQKDYYYTDKKGNHVSPASPDPRDDEHKESPDRYNANREDNGIAKLNRGTGSDYLEKRAKKATKQAGRTVRNTHPGSEKYQRAKNTIDKAKYDAKYASDKSKEKIGKWVNRGKIKDLGESVFDSEDPQYYDYLYEGGEGYEIEDDPKWHEPAFNMTGDDGEYYHKDGDIPSFVDAATPGKGEQKPAVGESFLDFELI